MNEKEKKLLKDAARLDKLFSNKAAKQHRDALLARIDKRIKNAQESVFNFKRGITDAKRGFSDVTRAGLITIQTRYSERDVVDFTQQLEKWEAVLRDWNEIRTIVANATLDDL